MIRKALHIRQRFIIILLFFNFYVYCWRLGINCEHGSLIIFLLLKQLFLIFPSYKLSKQQNIMSNFFSISKYTFLILD
jgi:hypothetical protein